MKSIKFINDLNNLPTDDKYKKMSYSEILDCLSIKKTQDCLIEASFAVEIGMLALFENRNVPDSIFESYKASFPNSDTTLYKHYLEKLDKGEESVNGFINNLKGKAFEFELPDKLEEIYPNYRFDIASLQNQPDWDIHAVSADGLHEFYIQAKMWAASKSQTSELQTIMENNPNILYATSKEIREKILANAPELEDQFIPIDISIYDFTNDVKENLNNLVSNMGIDVPDEIGDFLPYISEIVLGIRLIFDLVSVQRDFKTISATDKAKLSAVKVLVLFSRFGITTVSVLICSAAGGYISGPGAPIGATMGSVTGAGLAGFVNKKVKPYMLEIALGLVGLDQEDMFYFNNKKRIDNIAYSYKTIQI